MYNNTTVSLTIINVTFLMLIERIEINQCSVTRKQNTVYLFFHCVLYIHMEGLISETPAHFQFKIQNIYIL